MSHRIVLAVLAAVAFALGSAPAHAQGDAVVASMGSIRLTAGEVKALLDAQQPAVRQAFAASPDALEKAVRTELVRRALLAEAEAKGWDKQPEVAARIARTRDEVVVTSYINAIARPPADYPSDAEVKAFFEANRDKLQLPTRYHLAQIYVKLPADAAAMPAAAKKAKDLAARAAAGGGAAFEALAKASSEHESAARGGDIGWIVEANTLPEIRAALPKLAKGGVSPAIKTADGWHILRLLETIPAGPATLDQARPSIVNTLRLQKAQQIEREYLDAMVAKTPVTIDRAALDKLK